MENACYFFKGRLGLKNRDLIENNTTKGRMQVETVLLAGNIL